jgi:RimJ/RimL family protein N-acetyltransferase
MIPVIETDRLRLRAPVKEDFEAVAVFLGGPRAAYVGGARPRLEAWKSFATIVGTWLLDGYGYWSVERRADGVLVGAVGYQGPPRFAEIELGWDLYDGFEGHGYATEAARAARDWGFATAGFPTVVSYVDAANARSIAVADRLGCTRDAHAARPDPEDIVFRHPSPEALR